MASQAEQLILDFSTDTRAILLGGMAMLAHGFIRHTKDIDVWLDPTPGSEKWAKKITEKISMFKEIKLISVYDKHEIKVSELAELAIEEDMFRIEGLDMMIDIFYRPNNLSVDDFENIWNRASTQERLLRIPDEIDLALTKLGTGRIQDQIDIEWLDAKIIPELQKILKSCDLNTASEIFSRISNKELCEAAIKNSNQLVKSLGLMTKKKLSYQ